MAETELQILIKVVDEATATLKNIQGTLEKQSKSIQKQAEATTNSFNKQMGSLLVLGQAAGTVDHMFSSYQNLQLRLENATERVANATDRLSDAEYNLKKVQKDTTASAEDLAKAQQDVERANRGLTISQNNLARANNMVWGTYINLGVQGISLLRQLPLLKAEVISMTTATYAWASANMSVVGPLMIITGAIAGISLAFSDARKQADSFNKIGAVMQDTTLALAKNQEELNGKMSSYISYLNEIYQTQNDSLGLTKEEAQAKAEVILAQEKLATFPSTWSREKSDAETALMFAQEKLEIAEKNKQSLLDHNTLLYLQQGLNEGIFDDQIIQLQSVEAGWGNAKNAFVFYHDDMMAKLDAEQKAVDDIWKAMAKNQSWVGKFFGGMPVTKITRVRQDFISRPGGGIQSFSPDDTIIGMKNPGALGGITITGNNIYGTDPKDIADAIMVQLRRKISV